MLDYFEPSYFIDHARYSLIAFRMRLKSATEYIDEFIKYLVNYADVLKSEAKFIFKINLANWLSALVLPYIYTDFYAKILYSK